MYREALIGTVHSDGVQAQLMTVSPTRHRGKDFPFRIETSLPKGESMSIDVGLLAANRLVNNETIAVLYQSRRFDFGTNVGAIAAFFGRIPEQGRQNLTEIAMEYHDKWEPDYCCGLRKNHVWGKGSGNQAAWGKACMYIMNNVKVKGLYLTVNVKVSAEFKSLKWVKDLVKIKGLKFLTLEVKQHSGNGPDGPDIVRASYREGNLIATRPCFNEHLVPLFHYLREEMLG